MTLDGIPSLLENTDGLLRRRARGNRLLPKLNVGPSERFGVGFEALRRWTDGTPPADVSARPVIARKIYEAIAPVLRASAWPRWLYLERAFLDESEGGDLLFFAVAIRTMCEEAQRLHSLDLGAGEMDLLRMFTTRVDEVRELQRKAKGARPDQELYREYLITVSQMTDDVSQRRKREQILGNVFE
jgi:hypothetical protein